MKKLPKNIFNMYVNLNDDKDSLNEKFTKYQKFRNKKFKINILFHPYDIIKSPNETLELINKLSLEYNVNPTNCLFSIATDGLISEKALERFEQFDFLINKKYKNNLLILDSENFFDLKTVRRVSNEFYEFGKICHLKRLTPLEALLWCYITATKRSYNAESEDEGSGMSRSIYGVLSSNRIVCVGYVNLIINYLTAYYKNYTNSILTFNNRTKSKTKKGLAGHRSLVIYIKDPKYNVDGYYLLDPTKDNAGNGNNIWLNYFLISLPDLQYSTAQYLDYKAGKISVPHPTTYPNALDLGYLPTYIYDRDDISLSQSGLSFRSNASFEMFLEKNKRINPKFETLLELIDNTTPPTLKTINAIESFLHENSEPITYLTLQSLGYNTMAKVSNKNKDKSKLWALAQDIMRYNTQRSKWTFIPTPNVKNAFFNQYLSEQTAQDDSTPTC